MRRDELKLCEHGTNCDPCWGCEDQHYCAHFDVEIWHGLLCDKCEKREGCEHYEVGDA